MADQDGDPIPFVSVEALQYGYQSGKKALRSVSNVRTDDRGYRLFGLAPGRYYVRAALRAAGTTGLSSTFFPVYVTWRKLPYWKLPLPPSCAPSRSTPRPDALHSITGKVVDGQTGQPVAGVYVMARTKSYGFRQRRPATHRFIHGPWPGARQYVLTAQEFSAGAPKTGRLIVDLGDADLSGVVLTLSSGVDLWGAIRDLPRRGEDTHLNPARQSRFRHLLGDSHCQGDICPSAATAGKYEFEIRSGTAIFMQSLG